MTQYQQTFDPPLPPANAIIAELPPDDLNAITVTLNRYAIGTDEADEQILASTFARQAVFTGRAGDSAPYVELRGSGQEIAAWVVEKSRQLGYIPRHFITNVIVQRLTDSSVRVQAYFLVTRPSGNDFINTTTGVYRASLVRASGSVWQIERIDIHHDSTALADAIHALSGHRD
jgi:hypothetical protein